jgi:hypothetical protein
MQHGEYQECNFKHQSTGVTGVTANKYYVLTKALEWEQLIALPLALAASPQIADEATARQKSQNIQEITQTFPGDPYGPYPLRRWAIWLSSRAEHRPQR